MKKISKIGSCLSCLAGFSRWNSFLQVFSDLGFFGPRRCGIRLTLPRRPSTGEHIVASEFSWEKKIEKRILLKRCFIVFPKVFQGGFCGRQVFNDSSKRRVF